MLINYSHGEQMSDATLLLDAVEQGDPNAPEKLLAIVYEELRALAASKLAKELPGQTLQPTALVHEAWISLVGAQGAQFENRAHFFGAAAEAMRRILVDSARRKRSLKRGSGAKREELQESHWIQEVQSDELLAVDEALHLLSRQDPIGAELVKLRYFVGMNMEEAASALNAASALSSCLLTR